MPNGRSLLARFVAAPPGACPPARPPLRPGRFVVAGELAMKLQAGENAAISSRSISRTSPRRRRRSESSFAVARPSESTRRLVAPTLNQVVRRLGRRSPGTARRAYPGRGRRGGAGEIRAGLGERVNVVGGEGDERLAQRLGCLGDLPPAEARNRFSRSLPLQRDLDGAVGHRGQGGNRCPPTPSAKSSAG